MIAATPTPTTYDDLLTMPMTKDARSCVIRNRHREYTVEQAMRLLRWNGHRFVKYAMPDDMKGLKVLDMSNIVGHKRR